MHLYAGSILFVDLSSGRIDRMPLRNDFANDYWGCWGLALRYFCELADPQVDPLSPENPLVLMTGTLGGTLAPLSGRMCLVSKSPQTGTVFQSNVGGSLANELKFAGLDGIVITGRAESPVYLRIAGNDISLQPADHLWGEGIFATDEQLKEELGDDEAKTLTIGPAGENLIPYACIGSEAYRQLGRGGGGALFGSKNFKGLVCRGNGGISVADLPAFLASARRHRDNSVLTDANLWARTDGTPILMEATNEMGIHPTRNFSEGINDKIAPLNSDSMKANKRGDRACASCPLACGKFTVVNGAAMEGPEYETLCMGGSNCGVNDLEAVIHFNRLCDDLGLDTISCGSVIALAMEISETGRADLGLRFGDIPGYLQAVTEIARLSSERGRTMAGGARHLAGVYASSDLSTEIKGMELPAYDPRGNYGMGLSYATSERGACHMRAFTVFSDNPLDIEQQARDVVDTQNLNAIKWSLGFCDVWANLTPEIMAELLSTGLGRTVDAGELLLAGERIWNLGRLFNLAAGLTAEDDSLPEKILKRGLKKGPHDGRVFPAEDFAEALALFYHLRGWDAAGIPRDETLQRLSLRSLKKDESCRRP